MTPASDDHLTDTCELVAKGGHCERVYRRVSICYAFIRMSHYVSHNQIAIRLSKTPDVSVSTGRDNGSGVLLPMPRFTFARGLQHTSGSFAPLRSRYVAFARFLSP